MRTVALGSTFYHYFGTRRFSTGASFTLAGTPAIHAYEDGGTTQITAGLTLTADFDSVTGLNQVAIAATTGNGFEAGKHYTLTIGAGTVDSVSVVGQPVGEFIIETAAQLAQRQYLEKVYPGHVVSTTTNNSTTSINLTEIVDAQSTKLVGEVLGVCDVTDDRVILVRVTAFTYPQATVEGLDGAAMAFTVASGDMIWRVGQYTADVARVKNVTASSTTSGHLDVDVQYINAVEVTGAGTSGDKWRAA